MNLFQSTRIMISLALNVQKNDDGAITLKVFNILTVTSFMFLAWQVGQFLATSKAGLSLLVSDVLQVVINKLLSVGFNSLAWSGAL